MVQRACRRLGLSVPTAVVGNTDAQVAQLLELAIEEGEELSSRHGWSALTAEATYTQVAARDQGLLSTLASGFESMIPESFWNRTTTLPVVGPVTPRDWQMLMAFPVTGPYQQFKIEGGHLYIDPIPPNATDSLAFHYKSRNWCESSGGTGQSEWSADTDVGRLEEDLMRQGLMWRWKSAKGLDYAQDFEGYERRVLDLIARDKAPGPLRLDGGISRRVPGVMVPVGSWSV